MSPPGRERFGAGFLTSPKRVVRSGDRTTTLVHATSLIVCAAVGLCLLAGCRARRPREHVLMRVPNLYAARACDPFAEVPCAYRSALAPILYVTDREVAGCDLRGIQYSSGRSGRMAFGTCVVEFGRGLTWEQVTWQSLERRRQHDMRLRIARTCEQGYFPPTPREAHAERFPPTEEGDLAYAAAVEQARTQLCSLIDERLAQTPVKDAYVYVHGYNNLFEEAVKVGAELWHFLGRRGVPILYSWPAGHRGVLGYLADRESGEASVSHLKTFLETLGRCPQVNQVHLIAHSRGADVVTKALRELHIRFQAEGKDTRGELKLSNLVLAAPDIDIFVLQQRIAAEGVQYVPQRVTIYASSDDRAINVSQWINGGFRRLGGLDPKELTAAEVRNLSRYESINLILTSVGGSDFFAHSYFTDSPAVSSDLILLLRCGRPPGAAYGRPLEPEQGNTWLLKDGYPFRPLVPALQAATM